MKLEKFEMKNAIPFLSARLEEITLGLLEDKAPKQIANELGIGIRCVRWHLTILKQLMGTRNTMTALLRLVWTVGFEAGRRSKEEQANG